MGRFIASTHYNNSITSNHSFFIMRTINGTTYTKEQLEIVRKFFTDDQWDIIDYALSEYQDHEETFELTRETQDQLGELFQAPYDS